MTRSRWILAVCSLVALFAGGWLRAHYAPEWWPATKAPALHPPYLVEADCYSQLARVQRILHGQGLIQSHFAVENWPEGLTPSTTATFDYVILLLYAPLALITRHPLEWAGVLISPALWLGLVIFWGFFRSREFTSVGRAALILGSALLPALIWATSFGRPRHQSLILALMAVGFTLEYERWLPDGKAAARCVGSLAAGIVWGLACWTSLFEPPVVFGALVLFNLAVRRRESPALAFGFGVVMLVALLLEGVHIFVPAPEQRATLLRWLQFISEVRGLSFVELANWMTLVFLLLPFVAWRLWRAGNRTDLLLVLLTAGLMILTIFQQRWMYYACLGELFLLARYFQSGPERWTRWVVITVFLLGTLYANDQQVALAGQTPPNQPSVEMAAVAQAIDAPGGIMAPWWISPGLLYFSGQPIVSGSSHCGISGIEASARFYASMSWVEAEKILRERQVRWVVVWDEPLYQFPLLASSQQILGTPVTTDENKAYADTTVSQILINNRFVPTALHLRAVTAHLKLYEYEPGRR